MQKTFIIFATSFGALAVILGAFGAHALKSKISAEHLQMFETGVRYQFYHALALLLALCSCDKIAAGPAQIAGCLFIAGIILFSGSIYLLATRELFGIDSLEKFSRSDNSFRRTCAYFPVGYFFLLQLGKDLSKYCI